jgi:PAS domain S-box-containing protein
MRLPALRHSVPAILLIMGGAAVAFLSVFHLHRIEARVTHHAGMEARRVGALVAMQLEKALRIGDDSGARDVVSHLATDPRLDFAGLVDPNGKVLFATELRHEGRAARALPHTGLGPIIARALETQSAQSQVLEGQRIIAAFPVHFRAQSDDLLPTQDGAIVIRYDLSGRLAAARRDALVEAAVAGLAVFGAALLIYLFFRFALLARLRRLIDAAARLAAGDYAARAHLRGGDEIAAVAHAFDRMATQLEERTRQLRENEEKLRNLIESMPDALLVVDGEGRVQFANPSCEEVLGCTATHIEGTLLTDVIREGDRDHVLQALGRLQAAAEPCFEITEAQVRHGDTSRPVELLLARPADMATTGGHLVHVRDVTERHRLEQQLILSQKLEAVAHLAGGVAHDFNNLLAVVLGSAEALLTIKPQDADSREMIEEIRTAAMRGAALTKQLLAMGRRERSDAALLDLNEVVDETRQLLQRVLPANIRLDIQADPQLPPVMADPTQMAQVLMNLAVNARDAMAHGGDLRIRTRRLNVGPHSPSVELEVTDTGTGMTPEVQRRLFEPFFTTKGAGAGTGLGLPTAYRIVQGAGGDIDVESQAHRGTTFRVRLPAAEDERTGPVSRFPTSATKPGQGQQVLVVEDEAPLRRTLARTLANHGYRVTAVASAEEALTRIEHDRDDVSLVLTDFMLPGINGWELLLRIETGWRGLPVVIMSGHTDDEEARARMVEEGVPLLSKPFDTSSLLAVIRQRLDTAPGNTSADTG